MKIRYRFAVSLSVTAVLLVTAAVIFTQGFGIEIRASADTPPLMPDAIDANKAKGHMLPAAGDVLIVGGMGSGRTRMKTVATAEFYDPNKGEFFQTGSIPVTAAIQGASLVSASPGAKVAVFGGISGMGHANVNLLSFTGTVVSSAETYDPSTGAWTATANMMSAARAGATATLLPSGKILIAGGFDASENALNTAEIFNPADGTFVATDNTMTDARGFHTASLLLDGKVLLVSGLTDNNGSPSSTADIFDPTAGTNGRFTESSGFPAPSAAGASVVFPGGPLMGKVLITGGDGCTTGAVCSFPTSELYNPVMDEFIPVSSMNESRMNHTATLLQNGKVLITAGINVFATMSSGKVNGAGAATTFSKSAELFDPVTMTFTCVGGATATGCSPTMVNTRAGHSATLLSNGNVLIAGGFVAYGRPIFQMGNATKSAEIFDPTTGKFTKTKSMHTARGGHTATVLQ
jgi:Galactose oxidase, central domain/Kelch motif